MTTPNAAAETRERLMGVDPGSPAGDSPETPKSEETPQGQPAGDTKKYVTLEAHQELLRRLDSKDAQLAELQSVAGIVRKAQEFFGGAAKAEPELTDRDRAVKSEILRIMPELADAVAAGKDVKDLKATVQATGAAAQEQIATAAWGVQQQLQGQYGVAVGDADASEMIGTNIMGWINKDQARVRRYYAGDRSVLEEGFKHVVGKLYGPDRLAGKREMRQRRDALPTGGPSRGGSPAGGGDGQGAPKIDFRNRSAVRAALAGSLGNSDRD